MGEVNCSARRKIQQRGQAVVLLVLSVSIFLLVAMGFAIDGSQLYAQRQMAQLAADAAAQAGIVSVFNGSSSLGSTIYYCTSSDTSSPCTYASKNGYTAGTCTALSSAAVGADCIKVDPNPGVSVVDLSVTSPNELQVTITRAVPMTLMKLIGISSLDVTAQATAALLDVKSPVPILVTQPWCGSGSCPFLSSWSGTKNNGPFNLQGNANIQICGGPQRSIQVNSFSSSSLTWNGNPTVDLSKGGPSDTAGDCSSGTGTDFGDFGGPSGGSTLLKTPLGSTEHFNQPSDPVPDPLSDVSPPDATGFPVNPSPTALANGVSGCPASPSKPCMLYSPGKYTSVIDVKNQTAVFSPGIYYMYGVNFQDDSNGAMYMATGFTDTTTGTNWTGNIMVYMTGPSTTTGGCTSVQTGTLSVGANGAAFLTGSPSSSSYKGILFWVDRSATSQLHHLGGGGAMSLIGTVYMTSTLMGTSASATCSQLQLLSLQGTSGNATTIEGEIIVSTLNVQGDAGITMDLSPAPKFTVRQIALVNGE